MLLNLAKKDWQLPSNHKQAPIQSIQTNKAGKSFSPAFLRLIEERGYDEETLDFLLDDQPQVFHNPYLLYDMDRAIERIQEAIMEGQSILVYGDYDADGVTSSLILTEAISQLGGQVQAYLPNRFSDGYGPNLNRYQEFVDQGIELIITCDNGVAGFEALAWAKDQGIDVIVTDHHQIQDQLPEAYAIIHPQHPQGQYPFKDLCGAGVALKVVSALLEEVPVEALELAMIGTIADMVSLTDENRTIVKSGLNLIKNSQRPGIQALFQANQVDPDTINEETIGFIIGPRLNAAGRLEDPRPAYELLASQDMSEAQILVEEIEGLNRKRQDLVKGILQDIDNRLSQAESLPDIIIEASPSWPAGVLGIAAGNLCQAYNRPVILFQELEEGQYRGSGRSIKGINLFQLLDQHKSLIKYFGGHDQAAGLTLDQETYPNFKAELTQACQVYRDLILQAPKLAIDLILDFEEVTIDLVEELDLLSPFGMDHPKPKVLLQDQEVTGTRLMGRDQSHIKFDFQIPGSDQVWSAVGFSMADQGRSIQANQEISLVGQLSLNHFRNQTSVQLILEDLGVKGCLWKDYRASQVKDEILQVQEALYLFRNSQVLDLYHDQLPVSSKAILYKEFNGTKLDQTYQHLVIFEPAKSLEDLQLIIHSQDWTSISLGAYQVESKFLAGLPSQEDFKRFFIWQMKQGPYEIRSQLHRISQQVNLPIIKIKLMIMMFLEAGFVTIKNGWIKNLDFPRNQKVNLQQLETYQKYKAAMDLEELLNFQPISWIKKYFERD